MDSQEIVDYVMETPGNTNPAILKQMIDGVSSSGGVEVIRIIPQSMPYSVDEALAIYNAWLNGAVVYFQSIGNLNNGGGGTVGKVVAFGVNAMDSSGYSVSLAPVWAKGTETAVISNFHSGEFDRSLIYD